MTQIQNLPLVSENGEVGDSDQVLLYSPAQGLAVRAPLSQLAEKISDLLPTDSPFNITEELAAAMTELAGAADEIPIVAGIADEVVTVAGIAEDVRVVASYGNELVGGFVHLDEFSGVGDGQQIAWTLPRRPLRDENILVWVGGALQPVDAYSLNDDELVITPALPAGMTVRARLVAAATANVVEGYAQDAAADADRAEAALQAWLAATNPALAVKLQATGNGTQVSFPLLSSVPGVNGHLYLHVTLNGVLQPKDGAAYTVTDAGTKLLLPAAPAAGVKVYAEAAVTFSQVVTDSSLASAVLNDSLIAGATVKNALETLNDGKAQFTVFTGGTVRRLKDRWNHIIDIRDMPGAPDASGTNASTSALLAAAAETRRASVGGQPVPATVYIPEGKWVHDGSEELAFTRRNQRIIGEGAGMSYGTPMMADWREQGGGSQLIFAGTGTKYRRTRRYHRATGSDPQDPPFSACLAGLNQGLILERFSLHLDCDFNDTDPDNLGADWDVGLYSRGGNIWAHQFACLGYFRKVNVYQDVTHLDGANYGFLPFVSPWGVVYPIFPRDNNAFFGCDHQEWNTIYLRGGVKGTFVVLGARPAADGNVNYYEQSIGALTPDRRGINGASNVAISGQSVIFGHDHHSGVIRNPLPSVPADIAGADAFLQWGTPDERYGPLCLDSCHGMLSGAASRFGMRGFSMRGGRIAGKGPLWINLGWCDRASFDDVHIDGLSSEPNFGALIARAESRWWQLHSMGPLSKPQFCITTAVGGNFWSQNAIDSTASSSVHSIEANVFKARAPANGNTGEAVLAAWNGQGCRMKSGGATILQAPENGVYDNTTANPANTYVSSTNTLFRSTSSKRFKRDVRPMTLEEAERVLKLEPIRYRSLGAADDPAHSHYGLLAEDAAAIDPRWVIWRNEEVSIRQVNGNDGEPLTDVNGEPIKEEIKEKLENPVPDGVAYDRLTVALLKLVQEQQKRIKALEDLCCRK